MLSLYNYFDPVNLIYSNLGLSSNSLGRTSSPATNSPAFQSTFVSKGGDSGRSRKVAAVFQEEEEETHSAKDTARKRKVEKPKEIKNQEEKRKAVKVTYFLSWNFVHGVFKSIHNKLFQGSDWQNSNRQGPTFCIPDALE